MGDICLLRIYMFMEDAFCRHDMRSKMFHDNRASEKWLERELVRRTEQVGGVAYKLHSQQMTGFPDRLCLLPEGRTVLVELKSKGRTPSARQRLVIMKLRAIGHDVRVIDSEEGLDALFGDAE